MVESSSLVHEAIERILEMSADLQIERRATTKYSPAFYEYSEAIAGFGKMLEMLTGLRQREECSTSMVFGGDFDISREPQAVL